MARLEISTVINRPVEEVFAFLSNPENNPKWFSGSREVKITSAGPIGVGTTFRTVVTFLGRRIEGEIEFTEYVPNRSFAEKTKSGPFPVENRITVERVEGGHTGHQHASRGTRRLLQAGGATPGEHDQTPVRSRLR